MRRGGRYTNTYDLPSDCTEVAAANVCGSCGARARDRDAGERDQEGSRGACVHFFGGAWRGEDYSGADFGEGAELRERADGGALRGLRFVQGDCGGKFAGRD